MKLQDETEGQMERLETIFSRSKNPKAVARLDSDKAVMR